METGENMRENLGEDQPLPATPMPAGCYIANLILNIIVALTFGIGIIIILNILNRGGWFALLSGLFGMMMYIALVFPRLLFGPDFRAHRQRKQVVSAARQQEAEGQGRGATTTIYRGIALASIVGILAFIGLYFLPAHAAIFALLSAILGMLVCISGFALGLCILALFIMHRRQIRNNGIYFDL
jgi:hypothetical protein